MMISFSHKFTFLCRDLFYLLKTHLTKSGKSVMETHELNGDGLEELFNVLAPKVESKSDS